MARIKATKLTPDDVRLIKQLVVERQRLRDQVRELTNRNIAIKFNVKRSTIDAITMGVNWKTL
jgi:hypothetical protein